MLFGSVTSGSSLAHTSTPLWTHSNSAAGALPCGAVQRGHVARLSPGLSFQADTVYGGEDCVPGTKTKDLRWLWYTSLGRQGGWDATNTFVLDNSKHKIKLQSSNLILIPTLSQWHQANHQTEHCSTC